MNATTITASADDSRDTARISGISRRSILRGLIPAAAAVAGAAGLLTEAGAAGSNLLGGHGRGSSRRRGRHDGRRRDDREDGNRADRGRRPHREPDPVDVPVPGPGSGPVPSPVQLLPAVQASYSYDATGRLTILGQNFIPGVPVDIQVLGNWFPLLGIYQISYSFGVLPDASGSFAVSNDNFCPYQIAVTATQAGIAPVTSIADFGVYTCQVPH